MRLDKTGLTQELRELFQTYSDNRVNSTEIKWKNAYNAFHRIADPTKEWKEGEAEEWRSKAYLGATKQKVVAAVAIVNDVLVQNGKINYTLEASETDKEYLEIQGLPEDALDDNIEKMKAVMDTQLSRARADRKLLSLALSAAVYGRGFFFLNLDKWVKGGWKRVEGSEDTDFETFVRFQNEDLYPAWTTMSTWDVFWDLEAEKPREGKGIFHRTFVSKGTFADMKKDEDEDPWIIPEAIDRVLTASKDQVQDTSETTSPKTDYIQTTLNNIKLVKYWGKVTAKELKRFLSEKIGNADDFDGDSLDEFEEVDVSVVMAGKDLDIIRIAPIDPVLGHPVFSVEWDDSLDSVGATSVADNCLDTQHLMNGVFRALMDNMNLSGNSMIATKEELLEEPLKGVYPGKNIRIDPEADDVRQAVQGISFPDVSGGLLNTLSVVSQYLEEDSNVPRVQQGQEASRTETAFTTSRRIEGSGKYFARVIRNFDASSVDALTWMYDYNMLDPDLEEGKGDYEIQVNGFATFQNRVTRLNSMIQFLNVALAHPESYKNLKLDFIFRELARLLDLDPEQVALSPEEIRERDAQEEAVRQAEAEAAEAEKRGKEAATARDESQAAMNMSSIDKQKADMEIDQLKAIDETVNKETGE